MVVPLLEAQQAWECPNCDLRSDIARVKLGMITCEDCGQNFDQRADHGPLPVYCTPCLVQRKRDRTNAWHKANPDKVWKHKKRKPPVTDPMCMDCAQSFVRVSMKGNIPKRCPACYDIWRAGRKKHAARQRRFRRHGITAEQYGEMMAAQGGVCAICKTTNWGVKGAHIDHDHKTGKFRGILCNNCNPGIGNLRDDPVIIAAALEYVLKGHAGESPADRGSDEVVLS